MVVNHEGMDKSLEEDCGKCRASGKHIEKGCGEGAKADPSFKPRTILFAGTFDRCVKAWARDNTTEEWGRWIKDYQIMNRTEHLPRLGGFLDQDARFLSAYLVIDDEVYKTREGIRKYKEGIRRAREHRGK